MQAVADAIASFFVPCVVAIAVVVFISWALLGTYVTDPASLPPGTSPLLLALLHAISVLVVACPCSLGLATPTAVMVGVLGLKGCLRLAEHSFADAFRGGGGTAGGTARRAISAVGGGSGRTGSLGWLCSVSGRLHVWE